MLIGYARVSTDDQTTGIQREALRIAGCETVFEDVASGGDRARPELARALQRVGAGDTLVVLRIDRLARSLSHLLELVEALRGKGAFFRSLKDPIDTSSPQGMLMTQMLGAFAEFERALIRERTRAGVRAAAAAGRLPGNPKMRARDEAAIALMRQAQKERYAEEIIAGRRRWLPTVERLRPAYPWGAVVHVLAKRDIGRTFSEPSLVKACRLLVMRGYADPAILDRTPRAVADTRVARIVADRLIVQPGTSLRALASWLSNDLREPTPTGGFAWRAETVRREVEKARALGLLPQGEASGVEDVVQDG